MKRFAEANLAPWLTESRSTNEILRRVAELEISSWSYLWEDPSIRHIGPMAQDFYEAFGLGDSNLRIDPTDSFGVALASIQALQELIQRQDDELETPRERIQRLAHVRILEQEAHPTPGP